MLRRKQPGAGDYVESLQGVIFRDLSRPALKQKISRGRVRRDARLGKCGEICVQTWMKETVTGAYKRKRREPRTALNVKVCSQDATGA